MKILHVVNTAETGGAQTLIEAMCAQVNPQDEHHVFVLMSRDVLSERLEAVAASVYYGGMSKSSKNPLPVQRLLAQLVRKLGIDVVHSHLMQSDLVSALTRLPRPVARVSTLHTSGGHESSAAARFVGKAVALLSRRFDRVVACSPSAQRYAVSMGYRGAAEVPVVLNGTRLAARVMDTEATGTQPTGTQVTGAQPSGIQVGNTAMRAVSAAQPPHVLCLSRWHPMKDHDTLFHAFAILLNTQPTVVLECAGQQMTPDNPELVALLTRHGIAARVRLLGAVRDVPAVLHRASVLTISSSHGEALPMAGIEALAAGIPVVTTDVGDCNLLAISDDVLVPPQKPAQLARALERVLTTRDRDYASAARTLARERFDIETAIGRYHEMYDDVSAQRGGLAATRP